jgi:hypothetical protein
VFVANSPAAGEVSPKMVHGLAPLFLIVAIHPLALGFGSLPTRTVRSFVLKQRGTGVRTVGHHRVGHQCPRTVKRAPPKSWPGSKTGVVCVTVGIDGDLQKRVSPKSGPNWP